MLISGFGAMDAEQAFARASRARRRAAVARTLGRRRREHARLPVYDGGRGRAALPRGMREIPLAAIRGTLEPTRAAQFDGAFRPRGATRERWQRLWLARRRGAVLPPVTVVPVADGFAVRDGHHRVSVARAQGALTIDAVVDSA